MRLIALAGLLALTACGAVKNLDPLGGLGGPTDTARYGFETSDDGWAKPAACSTVSVFQAPGRSIFGRASLAVSVQSMSSLEADQGKAFVSVPLLNFTGKKITAWAYAPAGCEPDSLLPPYFQIYLKDGGDRVAVGPGTNLALENWAQAQFSPIASPLTYSGQVNGAYYPQFFDPATIKEVGIKLAFNSPASFKFTGVYLVDSVNW